MSSAFIKFKQQPIWLALIIVVILCVWLASGMLKADNRPETPNKQQSFPLVKVTVERFNAEQVTREISLYGRTEPDRIATIRAEVKGLVKQVHVQEGQSVTKGQKLVSLEKADYQSRLSSAQATLKQREVELAGAQKLQTQGYQSQTALAQAVANLEQAKAEVTQYQLMVQRTEILAPFDGIINERFVEQGDLLKDGDSVAKLVDLDPLVISANVTENHIQQLVHEQAAIGRMVSGEVLEGKIRYISSISEPGTNTFKIEVAVPNPNFSTLAGISTELALPLQKTWAIRITPSVMALDEEGNIGVKIVQNDQVKFVPIDIVKSDSQGVWLSGMGQQADVIILGHGFVRHGDKVQVNRVESTQTSASAISAKAQ
ncbi:efflux RND transporter periplasmic adaptor subunit [Paraglaciecola aestuariivivens]